MANEAKRKRRMQMGDKDPNGAQTVSTDTTSGIPPQPLPSMPQGAGNMMNNPQIGMSMGGGAAQSSSMSGKNLYPYGDGGLSLADGRMGGVGFVQNSGQPQNIVKGTRLNQQPYGSILQPKEGMSMEMLNGQAIAQEAVTRAQKLYAAGSGDPTPSYQVGPMGMLGTPVENSIAGQVNPGQISPQQPQQSGMTMPLMGNTTASVAQSGMNTGRGGGRNQNPQNA
jgi:hypothetical protein